MPVSRFEELDVYQLALTLQREVFRFSKSLPKDERFSLSYQIRKSSRSIGSKIADAWCKRQYADQYLWKLTDARAECCKTRHYLQTSLDCEYVTKSSYLSLLEQCVAIESELGGMIRQAGTWHPR